MKHFAIAIIILFSANVCAQNQFVKGYFVDDNSIVTECYIKNLDWRQNPTEFAYKIDLASEEELESTISKVQEFAIGTIVKYKRFNTKIERSSMDINKLNKTREPQWRQEQLFLKVLVEGDANLYVYVDNAVQKYFFDTKTLPIEQLVQIRYLDNDNISTNYYSYYKQQLSNNVNCKNAAAYFKNLKYDTSALTNHFLSYNECVGGSVITYERKNKKAFALKVAASVNLGKLSISDPSPIYNLNTKTSAVSPKIGFELEFYLPFNNNKWSIFSNPMYNRFNVETDFSNPDGITLNKNIDHTVVVDYNSIEIPIGIRHYFLLDSGAKIFVNGAVGYDFALNSSLHFTNRQNVVNARDHRVINSGYFLSFGAGYNYKKMFAELRFNAPRDLLGTSISEWYADFSTIGLLFSYELL